MLPFLLAVPPGIRAAPNMLHPSLTTPALLPRDSSNSTSTQPPSSSGLTVQVWAPLVAITLVIIVMITYSCMKRRRAGTAATLARATANGSTHELTADQLTGGAGSGTTAAAARRARRQRRTPSQISTRSLPAYMEDPGDSEMVLARATRDMEDPMPTVTEDNPDHDNTLRSLGEYNASANSHTPLLRTEFESQPQHLTPPHDSGGRTSFDTVHMGSEDSQHALLYARGFGHSRQPSAEEIQAMGEAPPYFEVIEQAGGQAAVSVEMREMSVGVGIDSEAGVEAPVATAPPGSHSRDMTTSTTTSSHTQRRSGFRNLAARLSQLMPSTSSTPGPQTAPAQTQMRTQTHSPTPPPLPPIPTNASSPPVSALTRTHTRHRSATFGSGSTLPRSLRSASSSTNLALRSTSNVTLALRSNSNSNINLNLTSPSTASLGPISAPLPHTLTRTAFVYPQSGPTTEQMRFISSRETVGRFGVPYGDAAERAVAEARVAGDDVAPPPFESPVAEVGGSLVWGGGDEGGTRDGEQEVASPREGEGSPVGSSNNAASDLSQPQPHPLRQPTPKRTDTHLSQSTRNSVASFQTALEHPDGHESEHGHGHEHSYDTTASASTPAPAALSLHIDFDVDFDVDAVKSVPTPPPTPPRAHPPPNPYALAVPGQGEIPSITVAPASPA